MSIFGLMFKAVRETVEDQVQQVLEQFRQFEPFEAAPAAAAGWEAEAGAEAEPQAMPGQESEAVPGASQPAPAPAPSEVVDAVFPGEDSGPEQAAGPGAADEPVETARAGVQPEPAPPAGGAPAQGGLGAAGSDASAAAAPAQGGLGAAGSDASAAAAPVPAGAGTAGTSEAAGPAAGSSRPAERTPDGAVLEHLRAHGGAARGSEIAEATGGESGAGIEEALQRLVLGGEIVQEADGTYRLAAGDGA
jgi:hypothetical protein